MVWPGYLVRRGKAHDKVGLVVGNLAVVRVAPLRRTALGTRVSPRQSGAGLPIAAMRVQVRLEDILETVCGICLARLGNPALGGHLRRGLDGEAEPQGRGPSRRSCRTR